MAKARTQAQRREHRLFVDQHDRVYSAVVEKETGDPCEMLRPLFKAPWLPPQEHSKYWKFRTDETDLQFVFLDYDALINDLAESHNAYRRRLVMYGRKMSGQAFDMNKPTPDVIEVVGPPPTSPVPAIMAKRGEAWILGLPNADGSLPIMPPWAKQVFTPELPLDEQLLGEHLKLPQVAAPAKGPGRPRSARRRRVDSLAMAIRPPQPAAAGG